MPFCSEKRPYAKPRNPALYILLLALLLSPGISKAEAYPYEGSRGWKSPGQNSQNFGALSNSVQRLEDLLNNNQQILNNVDYYDFQSRLYTLKQNASLDISKGSDASAFLGPAQSLENEINGRIKDSALMGGNKKAQVDFAIERLDSLYRAKSQELESEEANRYRELISDLKARSEKLTASSDEAQAHWMILEARDLESKLMDKVLFGSRRIKLTVTKDEEDLGKRNEPTPTNPTRARSEGQSEKSGNSSNPPGRQYIQQVKKAPLSIPSLISRIENELIDFHEKNQIGSFDMDSFTGRLLAEKRNLHVMMSKTGRISTRQESLARQQLEQLHEDINNRVLGKD
ncbi:MAG: hypothetical protein K2X27_12240 [Candidatus Obscuribacterales bacterium]|nr:hypothetical protein [Candidatus Obscuribacterales bacterium]